jgi:hypothetical protein
MIVFSMQAIVARPLLDDDRAHGGCPHPRPSRQDSKRDTFIKNQPL